jgi:hypothetical protein
VSFEQRTSSEGATVLHWSCDEACGASADFETDSFHSAWAALKAQRWTAGRDRNGEWLHRCGSCRKVISAREWLDRT